MENKQVVMIKHSFLHIKYDNTYYTNQSYDLSQRKIIDVTSRDKEFGIGLSPMKLGPMKSFDNEECKTFEIFYQTSKLYPGMLTDGKPNDKYFNWRNKWYKESLDTTSPKNLRYPIEDMGYSKSDCIGSLYYNNDKKDVEILTDYVETRKKVYIPNYARLVVKSDEFKKIKEMYDNNKLIALVDFDCFNYYSIHAKMNEYKSYVSNCKSKKIPVRYNEEDFLNINSVKDMVNCPFITVGHGIIIKMLLEKDIEVTEDGKIIDNVGVLS